MKNTTLIFAILFTPLSSFGFKGSHLEQSSELYGQEIKITNQKLARRIFRWMPGEAIHSSIVYGQLYKHQDYLFCKRTPDAITSCSIYFSHKANGSLASFERDTDYGQGDIVDVTHNKPLPFKAEVKINKQNLLIKFTDKNTTDRVLKKVDLGKFSESQGLNYNSETYSGEHVSCTTFQSDSGNHQRCLIRVPIKREKEEIILLPPT